METLKTNLISTTFMLLSVGIFITGLVGYSISDSKEFFMAILDSDGFNALGWTLLFSPLVVTLLFPIVMNKLNIIMSYVLFVVFCILDGLLLGIMFVIYTKSSILLTFGIVSITFIVMAIIGYTTKRDLSKLSSVLTMALIGLVITMILNWMIGSETISYITSGIAVIVYSGLIVVETKELKDLEATTTDIDSFRKNSIIGALSLHMSFISLFLHLLRFLGDKKI
jgi:FtsH-binding integral membrane protein